MSEQNQVFRGDRAPELSTNNDAAAKRKAAASQAEAIADKPVTAASFHDESELPAAPAAAPAPAPEPEVLKVVQEAPEPELKLDVDDSQLWHAPSTLSERIAALRSNAVATAHALDEQEAESRRIAKQLKSL